MNPSIPNKNERFGNSMSAKANNIKFEKNGNQRRVILLDGWRPGNQDINYSIMNGQLYWQGIYAGTYKKMRCFDEQGNSITIKGTIGDIQK
ncbi:MAG: hypothetical protein WCR55_13785 [Lentisphaerota bacterium]